MCKRESQPRRVHLQIKWTCRRKRWCRTPLVKSNWPRRPKMRFAKYSIWSKRILDRIVGRGARRQVQMGRVVRACCKTWTTDAASESPVRHLAGRLEAKAACLNLGSDHSHTHRDECMS